MSFRRPSSSLTPKMRKERKKRASLTEASPFVDSPAFAIFNDPDTPRAVDQNQHASPAVFSDITGVSNMAGPSPMKTPNGPEPSGRFPRPEDPDQSPVGPIPPYEPYEPADGKRLSVASLATPPSTPNPTSAPVPSVCTPSGSTVERAIKLMEQENPDARRIAVDSLVRLGAQAAPFAGRVVKLLSHTSEEVRETAIDCLERLGAHAAPVAGSVVRLIESQDVDARSAAAKALGVMGEHAAASAGQLAQLLEHSDKGVRSAVANALGNLGPHASDHAGLVAAMLTSDRSHVRRAALKALGRLKEHAAPFVSEIVPLMEDEDHATRWTAIKVLARLGQAVDTEAVDAIATHLDDPRSEVRVAAVESLAELGHIGNYVSGVVPLLSQISDTKALMASIGALSTVEHTDNSCELMVGALCQLDVHPDPQVQSAARTLLSELSVQLSLTNSKAEDAIETVALSDAHPLPVVSSPEEELTATRQLETNPEPKISHESLQTSTPYVVVQPASVATNVPAQDESSSWITYAAAAGVTAMAVYFMVEFCNRFRGRRASQ